MSWKNDPAYPILLSQAMDDMTTWTDPAYAIPLPQALEEWCTGTDSWFLKPWIPYGAVTLLVAPAKIGKTTWLMDLLAAQRHGVPFLGEIIPKVRVLYVTEQSPQVFKVQAVEAGIADDMNILFTARYRMLGRPWADICNLLLDIVQRYGVRLVILDTWTGLAGFKAEEENDSAEARMRLELLGPITALGTAIVIAAHQGHGQRAKTPISACRGASGLGDGVDQAIWFQKITSGKYDTRRSLWAEGRYLDTPEGKVGIMRQEQVALPQTPSSGAGGLAISIYVYKPLKAEDKLEIDREATRSAIRPAIWPGSGAPSGTYTLQQLMESWKVSRSTVRRRLDKLKTERFGAGTASRPYRYVISEERAIPPIEAEEA